MTLQPSKQYAGHRWHWLTTRQGPMCASWLADADGPGRGQWDISGEAFMADSPRAQEMQYLDVAIPPCAPLSKCGGGK